ncbi:MAG: tRNA (adenosine(37)-N6)-threonylcarbamoyltransferase complex ATPase subunit type 1 TsaE [Candidatus Pacebacteria bacterium]|nr:tRNA (adenosine(37)-N6)-threonylcarbamoyltransferase complex ATPase subunit type 1 TsaE [Candidatus Paceibacterota bacterium]
MKISLEQLPEFASNFLKDLSENPTNQNQALLICLSGNLGAGKTTFTQQIAKLLNVEETITSPTFVLMKKYSISFGQFKNLIHIDAYRIEDPNELNILKFSEICDDPENLILLEWPEKVEEVLPKERTTITFEVADENSREINIFKNV